MRLFRLAAEPANLAAARDAVFPDISNLDVAVIGEGQAGDPALARAPAFHGSSPMARG